MARTVQAYMANAKISDSYGSEVLNFKPAVHSF